MTHFIAVIWNQIHNISKVWLYCCNEHGDIYIYIYISFWVSFVNFGYLAVELLNYMVFLFLTFWRTIKLFSIVLHHFTFSSKMYADFKKCMQIWISPHLCQHFKKLLIAILIGVKWYLIVILVCVSLTNNSVEYLFMCLLVVSVFSLEECLFKSFAHFLIGMFLFLLLSCRCSLYVLHIKPLSDIWFADTFFPSVCCLFIFL